MGRRAPTPDPHLADDAVLRRRYRQLESRLVCAQGDIPEAAEAVQAVGERLRREVEGIADPAERLALAERAYLTVFKRLPWAANSTPTSTPNNGGSL